MRTIDLHTHILPERWPDLVERYGYEGWLRLDHHAPCRARMMIGDKFFREVESNCWDAGKRIEEGDAAGVHVQVLSTVPVMFSYWAKPRDTLDLAMRLNDHIASVVSDHPARFVGLGTLPMQDADLAVQELHRCCSPQSSGGLGMPGVQIGTNVNGLNLNHPSLMPIFQAAEEIGAAIFVHPWEMLGRDRMSQFWTPWLVGMPAETCLAICSMLMGGVLEKLPRLRVCFAHGGGSFPATIGRIQHGFEARPDLCATDTQVGPAHYLADAATWRPARFYVDSLVHDAPALELLLKRFGAERIALGSDYPFPLGEWPPGQIVRSLKQLTDRERELILGGTALDFLRLPAERFA